MINDDIGHCENPQSRLCILVAALIAVMLALDWRMTLLSLLLFPLLFLLIAYFTGQIRGFTRKDMKFH